MMTIIDTIKFASAMIFASQCPAQSQPSIIAAATDQDSIGYCNFLLDRILAKWKKAQQLYLDLAYPDDKYTGGQWAAGLIRNMSLYTKLIWTRRSKEIHEDDDVRWKEQKELTLDTSIRNLYVLGINSVACEERFLFDIKVATLLRLPITAKSQWIDAVTAAQDFFEKRTQLEIEIMRRFMERWRHRRQ